MHGEVSLVLFGIGCAWYVLEFFVQSLLIRNPQKSVDRKDHRVLLYLGWLSVALGSVFGYLLLFRPVRYSGGNVLTLSISGVILIVIGAVIRYVSIFTLKKYFTVNLAIAKDQRIVKTGMYRHIRHPSYSGLFLSHIGLGLVFSNWVSFLLIVLPFAVWILKRIGVEERMLLEAFPEEYGEYMKRTKRMIPLVF